MKDNPQVPEYTRVGAGQNSKRHKQLINSDWRPADKKYEHNTNEHFNNLKTKISFLT